MILGQKGAIEAGLIKKGLVVAGVDEVGRGCLAGPVYAAAVVLDYVKLKALPLKLKEQIRDSKTLSARQRQALVSAIQELALAYGHGQGGVSEIESAGILGATFLAMKRALSQLQVGFQLVLIDGHQRLPDYGGAQQAVIKGDQLCYNIAAASILAKEARDSYMREQAFQFPQYGFEQHVGYGTRRHLEAIRSFGLCPLHRRNFAPIRQSLGSTSSGQPTA